MSEFLVSNGPKGWLNAQAIAPGEEPVFAPERVRLSWMINAAVVGLPIVPFTIATRQVARSDDKRKVANEGEWTDIEIVGLPFDDTRLCAEEGHATVSFAQYDVRSQGPLDALMSPSEAARKRLEEGAPLQGWFSLAPLPAWESPDAQSYLDDLFESDLLRAICRMLMHPRATGAPNEHADVAFEEPPPLKLQLTGKSSGFEREHPPSGSWNPLGAMLLAAATDPLAALALGFATTVPMRPVTGGIVALPTGPVAIRISAKFIFPGTDQDVQIADVVWVEDAVQLPRSVMGLKAERVSVTPPQRMDRPRLETIGVSWERPDNSQWMVDAAEPYPVSYAVARVGENGADPKILLTPRHIQVGWHPYVAGKIRETSPIVFNDHVERTFGGNRPDPVGRAATYFVAAQDVFGRWGAWAKVAYQGEHEPPQIPGVQGVEVTPEGLLTVHFSWDWTTRSPEFIELRGAYADDPNNAVLTLRWRFPGGGDPQADPAHPLPAQAHLDLLNLKREVVSSGSQQDDPKVFDEPGARNYRLTLPLALDFAGKPWREFEITARGQCVVHARVNPNFNISPFGTAVRARVYNPIKPGAPQFLQVIDPEVPLWASLPDAAGVSRLVLRWGRVPNAQGYVVYEATESALLPGPTAISRTLPPGAVPLDTSLPFTDRLAALRRLNLKEKRFSFRRVNPELVLAQGGAVSYEVTLPRGSTVIHLYALTALTENQVESEWSADSNTYIAVAVPRLGEPTPPTLQATAVLDVLTRHVELRIRAGAGFKTSRVELYRTTREENSKTLDRMGPPIGKVELTGDEGKFVDERVPRWRRVWYRAVAWSAGDRRAGIVEARSSASAAVMVIVPSDVPPQILDVRVNEPGSTGSEARVIWSSDAPPTLTPLGYYDAVVEPSTFNGDLLIPVTQRLDEMKKVASMTGLPPIAGGGEIVRVGEGAAYRLVARVPRPAPNQPFTMLVKMIDPLGRVGSASVNVPSLNLFPTPVLGAISIHPHVGGILAGVVTVVWEILSPVEAGFLREYRLHVEIVDLFIEGIVFLNADVTLDQVEEIGPETLLILPLPSTPTLNQVWRRSGSQEYSVSVRVENPVQVIVHLVDPLGHVADANGDSGGGFE